MVTVKPGFADTTETSQKTREETSDKCLPQEKKGKKKKEKRPAGPQSKSAGKRARIVRVKRNGEQD